MGIFDWKHWIVILIVVVAIFGTKKLKNLGGDLGESIKGFRKAMSDDGPTASEEIQQVKFEQTLGSESRGTAVKHHAK